VYKNIAVELRRGTRENVLNRWGDVRSGRIKHWVKKEKGAWNIFAKKGKRREFLAH